MDCLDYDEYEIVVKTSSVKLNKHFVSKSDVLTNLINDTLDDTNIIVFPDTFDIESLKKCYEFYLLIKDLKILNEENQEVSYLDYKDFHLDRLIERYSNLNLDIPHKEVFDNLSSNKDFLNSLLGIMKVNDFLNLQVINKMLSPIYSNLILNIDYNEKVKIFKKIRTKLGHLNPDPNEN